MNALRIGSFIAATALTAYAVLSISSSPRAYGQSAAQVQAATDAGVAQIKDTLDASLRAIQEAAAAAQSTPAASPEAGSVAPREPLTISPSARQSLYEQLNCRDPKVRCLLAAQGGHILPPEDAGADGQSKPPTIGEVIKIYILGAPNAFQPNDLVSCTAADQTRDFAGSDLADAGGTVADGGDTTPLILTTFEVKVPDGPYFDVACRRTEARDGQVSEHRILTYRFYTSEDNPYHFEAVISVPLVLGGDRTIGTTTLPGTSQKVLTEHEDAKIAVSLGLHYFPFGIYGSGPWANSDARGCPKDSLLSQPCRLFLQPLGLEAAATLDLSLYQFGLAFEPIRGGAISAGFSVLKGDFMQSGYKPGMIFNDGTLPVDRRYMFRPYFAASLSPEILQFVINSLKDVRNIAPAR